MKLDLNIAGSPAEVRSQLAAAASDARRTDPHANLIFSALADVIGRKLAGAGPEAQMVANIAIEISDATGLTQKIEDFVERPFTNQAQRDQAAAAVAQRPTTATTAPEGAQTIPAPALTAPTPIVPAPQVSTQAAPIPGMATATITDPNATK